VADGTPAGIGQTWGSKPAMKGADAAKTGETPGLYWGQTPPAPKEKHLTKSHAMPTM